MSGGGKKIADVAFKASRTIDWEGMAKVLVSDEARKEFSTLRRAFDEVNTQLQTKFSQEPEPIEWDFYRKGIGSGMVDMYKEAYDSIEIPKYVDTVTPEYKPEFDALLVELKEAEEKSLKESTRLEKETIDVQEISKKLSTMTADEYFEKHPLLKKKFDDQIRNDYWGILTDLKKTLLLCLHCEFEKVNIFTTVIITTTKQSSLYTQRFDSFSEC